MRFILIITPISTKKHHFTPISIVIYYYFYLTPISTKKYYITPISKVIYYNYYPISQVIYYNYYSYFNEKNHITPISKVLYCITQILTMEPCMIPILTIGCCIFFIWIFITKSVHQLLVILFSSVKSYWKLIVFSQLKVYNQIGDLQEFINLYFPFLSL